MSGLPRQPGDSHEGRVLQGSSPDANVELEPEGDPQNDPAKCAADEQQDPGKVPVGRRSIGGDPLREDGEGGDQKGDDAADERARDEHRQDATGYGAMRTNRVERDAVWP